MCDSWLIGCRCRCDVVKSNGELGFAEASCMGMPPSCIDVCNDSPVLLSASSCTHHGPLRSGWISPLVHVWSKIGEAGVAVLHWNFKSDLPSAEWNQCDSPSYFEIRPSRSHGLRVAHHCTASLVDISRDPSLILLISIYLPIYPSIQRPSIYHVVSSSA